MGWWMLLPDFCNKTDCSVQPIANGALVLSIDTDFDGCMKLVKVRLFTDLLVDTMRPCYNSM